MSIAGFTGERALPLRGQGVSNALIELFTITIWGELDYLIVDMPPGIGEELLDLIRLIDGVQSVVIGASSVVAAKVVRRLLALLLEMRAPVLGIIENMASESAAMESVAAELSIPYLGGVPYDPRLERSVGDPDRFVRSAFARELERILIPALG
jgi:ATP-binding protein involved in chromosome partitioning